MPHVCIPHAVALLCGMQPHTFGVPPPPHVFPVPVHGGPQVTVLVQPSEMVPQFLPTGHAVIGWQMHWLLALHVEPGGQLPQFSV